VSRLNSWRIHCLNSRISRDPKPLTLAFSGVEWFANSCSSFFVRFSIFTTHHSSPSMKQSCHESVSTPLKTCFLVRVLAQARSRIHRQLEDSSFQTQNCLFAIFLCPSHPPRLPCLWQSHPNPAHPCQKPPQFFRPS